MVREECKYRYSIAKQKGILTAVSVVNVIDRWEEHGTFSKFHARRMRIVTLKLQHNTALGYVKNIRTH